MTNPSNLYAEKIFSEHPIAFWSLDDTADYVSLISESNRDISEWTLTNASAQIETSIIDEPFPQSVISRITAIDSETESSLQCVSPDIISMSDLDLDLATFSIGAFVYSKTPYVFGFDIGYEYFDTVSGTLVQDLKFFSSDLYDTWIFISETFQPRIQNTMIRLVVRARYFAGDETENYQFLVNGLSFGQWSEEFNSTSLGVYPQSFNGIFGVPAKSYGLQELDGYYAIRKNSLAAKNSGMPIVYGTSNSTILQPNGASPSLIVPGLGFFNESGKYKDYTVEFWVRINSDSVSEKRIFGNVYGSDGLYVNGPFLSLKVSNYVIRHYVGQWARPMLIQIRYSETSISLVINGEQVGELIANPDLITFPNAENDQGDSRDFLGFYAYEDVQPIEIEAVAIYGYKVPVQVAKRRLVYGQGVEFPENINNAYSGSSVFIDYPFSKYSKNYSYPNIGRWAQGSFDNLIIDGNVLAFPEYKKPLPVFRDRDASDWMGALEGAQNEDQAFISFYPNQSWANNAGYLSLEDFSLSSETLKAFYVVCKEKAVTSQRQSILTIDDLVGQSSFEISLDGDSIDYTIHSGGESNTIARKTRYFSGEEFVVGVDMQKFSDYYGGLAAQFFGRLSVFSVYIGGKRDFSDTFRGNLYNVGFCSAKNLAKISSIFYKDGTVLSDEFTDESNTLMDADAGTDTSSSALFQFIYDGGTLGGYSQTMIASHTASYDISLQRGLSGFNIAIGADSSWEDYIPLSYFAKNVQDSRGDERLDLDFIQFNINYPAPSIFVQESEPGVWSYEELKSEYSNPIQRSYDSLDNYLFSGFDSYDDLKNRAKNTYKYDTSNAIVRTYVTFQLLADGANRSSSTYSHTQLAPKDGILSPGAEWVNTKYEVVDGMIIYPPQSISFEDIAIVTHVEAITKNVYATPIKVRSLEYASLSLSDSAPTPIGTRFGNDIFPYRKDGFYFSYKQRNPFSIYKGSTPYLYLTRDSGITLRGAYDPEVNRGISVPINQSLSNDYKVIALQLSMRFDQDFFPYAPMQVFELQSKNSYIRVYLEATHPSGKRAKLYAINSRGELENGIAFYLNGKLVREPTITVKEWAMLGIRFANTQDFGNYAGALRLTAPLTINNISYYKSTNLQEVQAVVERLWFKVKESGPLTLDWNYWNAIPYLWQNVLVISSTSYYGVDPSDIYKIYTGTNKIIVDDEVSAEFGDYAYTIYSDVSWQTQVSKAV